MGVTWLRPPDTLITIDLSLFGPVGSRTIHAAWSRTTRRRSAC